jgi:hypothetical protein
MDEQKRSLQDYLSAWAVSSHEISAKDGERWRVYLVGGLEQVFFSIQLGIIIPTDELLFFRGVQTTNQLHMFLFVFLNEFRRLDGILVDLRLKTSLSLIQPAKTGC